MSDADMNDAEMIGRLKRVTRERVRDARQSIGRPHAAKAAADLAERLRRLPEISEARIVLSYAATTDEIDPAPAGEVLRARGAAIAFPRVEAPGVLGIHLVANAEEMAPGAYGIAEPSPENPRIAPDAVDAVFVPGIAFDEDLYRLGYGGGYYDRLLPLLRSDCVRIGLAYDEQLVGEIPCEEHDVRMDVICTPTREIRSGDHHLRY